MKQEQLRHPLEDYTICHYTPIINRDGNISQSKFTIKITTQLDYKNICAYFFQDNSVEKSYRDYFIFSQIIEENCHEEYIRSRYNFSVSPFIVVDIDTKKEKELKAIQKDGGVEKLFNFFKNDPHCFITGYSASGGGLRAIYILEGDYNFYADLLCEEEKLKEISISIYKFQNIVKYLKKSGFKHVEEYIDNSFEKNYVQGTYSLNSSYPHNINYDFQFLKPLSKYNYVEPTPIQYVETNLDDIDKTDLVNVLKNLKHKNGLDYQGALSFFSALQTINDEDISKALYINMYNNYQGTDSRKKYFGNGYYEFMNNVKKNKFKYKVDLINLLQSRYGIRVKKKVNTNQNQTDIFGREYDYKYIYKKYISENENIDLSNDKIVIRSDAGSGKSYFILKYLSEQEGIRIFAAPTNPLAEQVYEKYKKEYQNIKIVKFFGGKYEKFTGDCIIIINFQNLERLENKMSETNQIASVLVLDEIHKITDYSIFKTKQCIFPVATKSIFMSATPEPFLMGVKDYTYINFERDSGINKRNMILVNSSSKDTSRHTICKIIYDKYVKNKCKSKFVIFQNNKDDNNKIKSAFIQSSYLKNLNIDVVDSKNKDENYNSIINNNIIVNNLITTSLLNEGVNILNKDIEDVFIIDNNTQSVFDVYQFCERFRLSAPNIYYFYHNTFTKKGDVLEVLDLDYKSFDVLYDNKKKMVESDIKLINNIQNNTKYNTDFLNIRNIFQDRKTYNINKNKIKLEIYNDFKLKTRSNMNYFKILLDSYFNIIDTKYITKKVEKEKVSKEEIEFLKINIDKVILKITKNINCVDQDENELLDRIIENNKNLIKKIKSRYKKLETLELNWKLFDLFMARDKFRNLINKNMVKKIKLNTLKSKADEKYIECYNNVLKLLKNNKEFESFKECVSLINNNLLQQFKINVDDELKVVNKKLLDNGFNVRYKKDKRLNKIRQIKR